MSFVYSVFGLTVRSSSPIPGLTPSQGPKELSQSSLYFGYSPNSSGEKSPIPSESIIYTSAYTGPSGNPALRIFQEEEHDLFHLVYFDGMQFWMDRHGTKLWASWPSESSAEEAATYILGPVLGLLLRFRGITCLHASAVAIGGSVIAFVGAEGAGKSTTAAAFAPGWFCRGFRRCCGSGRARRRLLLFRPPIRILPLAGIGRNVIWNRRCSSSFRSKLGKTPPFFCKWRRSLSRIAALPSSRDLSPG